ncbi:RluA family pseudouridine synthase [Streptococcus hyovaginalis]
MRFSFDVHRPGKVKSLLKEHDISKGLLAKIKFKGGAIYVNGHERNAIYMVDIGDTITVDIPDELPYEKLEPIEVPLSVVAEDDHFLVLNKPSGVASIPSVNHSNTMANFVKGYFMKKQYPNLQVHIVTRLDRDTSGLMLFAKHGYAHARLDKQLQQKVIEKRYYALVSGDDELPSKGEIIAPIARDEDSIITRRVHKSGKYAHTSYQVVASYGKVHLVDIQLHTGRTHQIRVHFAHLGFPLLGDDLYGGRMDLGITRQALHCHTLSFFDPFKKERAVHELGLTNDFGNVIMSLEK